MNSSTEPIDKWYRYYAGYSASFVDYVLTEVAPSSEAVLDPWNGTGTTTVLAAKKGLTTYGFDVNPAMVIVAKARLLHSGVSGSINSIADDIANSAEKVMVHGDPLHFWFSNTAAAHLRGLQSRAHQLLVTNERAAFSSVTSPEQLSTLAAFFYTVLFRTARILAAPASGTNPTWWKARTEQNKLKPRKDVIVEVFRAAAVELCEGLHGDEFPEAVDIKLGVADSRQIPLTEASVDAIITSPPYCTRIDYAVSTRPELAILGYRESGLNSLRELMVGTPTMTKDQRSLLTPPGIIERAFLDAVASHASVASKGYYLKYYTQYYAAMALSLSELRRVLRPGAPCVLVVQDTHYKQIRNDTPAILLEMASSLGFKSGVRHDFVVARSKASMNPKARAYRRSAAAVESVLVLR